MNAAKTATLLLVGAKLGNSYGAIAPPAGLYKLYGYTQSHGVTVEVLDQDIDTPELYLERAANGCYDIIGFSVTHDNLFQDADLVWQFRRAVEASGHKALIIAGGQEAALNHRQWLKMGIDLILLGFAEKSLTLLCQRLHAVPLGADGRFDIPVIVEPISGVAYLSADSPDGTVYRQVPPMTNSEFRELFYTELMQNDRLPFPLYWKKLRQRMADSTIGSAAGFVIETVRLYTTSHCPRRCGFCNSQSFLPASTEGKLPILTLTAQECADLVKKYVDSYGARCVMFSDDDFPVGNKPGLERVRDFCNLIIDMKQRGELSVDIRFGAQTRVKDFTIINPDGSREANYDILQLMAKAGFNGVSMGVETFSDRVLRVPSINKVGIFSSDCIAVIRAMKAAGMTPQINLILGIVEYTPDELLETMTIAYDLLVDNCDVVINKHMVALPGAPLYDNPAYAKTYKYWHHPVTGEIIEIGDTFIPQHPVIAQISHGFDSETQKEMDEMRQRFNLDGKVIHRRSVALCAFTAVCTLLGAHEQAAKFRTFRDSLFQ